MYFTTDTMKKILGLDLGPNSIGWALVNEKENDNEASSIQKVGVRKISLDNFVSTQTGKESKDPLKDFQSGKGISTCAGRTQKRSMRRNLMRYKMRRDSLIETLKSNGFITDETILSEHGNKTTFETYELRAKAATEEITKEELARVLLMINKKRGYKSNRKIKSKDEDGQIINGLDVAKKLQNEHITPGQYVLSLILQGRKDIPDFYLSDLRTEFDRIWDFQKQFYPEILTDELKSELEGKNKSQTWAICSIPFDIKGISRETKGDEQKKENYTWRAESLERKIDLERLAIVLQEVNNQLKNSSGYLGAISDRSKELYFRRQTVGQFLMAELGKNPNYSLKNKAFYRQDYLDEFERIWETQAKFHDELTPELKHVIRDVIIFYQRPLKSQKRLVDFCEFESRQVEMDIDGKKKTKTIGLKACPTSSPLYQEFRLWQIINNIQVSGMIVPDSQPDLFGNTPKYKYGKRFLEQDEKEMLFKELTIREKLTKKDILKLLFENYNELNLNYKEIKGNTTQAAIVKACLRIIELSGHDTTYVKRMTSDETIGFIEKIFNALEIKTNFLHFDSSVEGKDFVKQPAYSFWHLLYSYEGDNKSVSGDKKLKERISELCNLNENYKEYATVMAGIALEQGYGSLSAKVIRKILPYMKDGLEYSTACLYAGYKHSKRSLTKEELDAKPLKDQIAPLPCNSLRSPVVEKILNQTINVVNSVMSQYGKLDEIRIEMARELKRSASEREKTVKAIKKTTDENEKYRKTLQEEFNIKNPSRNDIIKYRLYLELEKNGFKTLYSGTYIKQERLFSKDFNIEHIIPQAKLFDDSFANKTLEATSINIEKGDMTAYDYVSNKYGKEGLERYKQRIDALYEKGEISKTKRKRLLTTEADIPDGFINRELNETQYIARKAREILEEVVRTVTPTTGSITDRLREDWQLVDVMKELNWKKYDKLGLTEIVEDKDGRRIGRIKDWTKRNDNRHHAMDAITIAFTKPSYIQYLNNLNAKSDKSKSIYGIERKELYRDKSGRLRFIPPMPLDEFRVEAKRQLENVLVSVKARSKVVSSNINITKAKSFTKGIRKKTQLTPRGQLHNETIYGTIRQYAVKEEKVNASFDETKIMTVACKRYREALLDRLKLCYNDAKKTFTGKNSLEKNPIFIDKLHTEKIPIKVKTVTMETIYTQRKEVSKDLKIDKVIDVKVRKILEERLKQYGGDAQKAFSNLEENPIWLNKEKGIAIKRVTIKGVSNAIALHDKRDNQGRLMLDAEGKKQPVDFVNTGNNHHVAIFRDADGNLQEHVVSFYEATARAIQHLPVIDKDYKKSDGWQFLFTMKQNEYFVFPNEETGFDPNETDLLDPKNYAAISPNLFRVQKLSTKNYMFRHHLETTVEERKELYGITWKNLRSLSGIDKLVKVRINNLGQIVGIGEY